MMTLPGGPRSAKPRGRHVNEWEELLEGQIAGGAVVTESGDRRAVARFTDTATEYEAIADGAALVVRGECGLLEVTGADRATWLHNLTTNNVKTLSSGEGHYAFALNVKGRILFDLNLLVRRESIWLDIDRRFLPLARGHFEKYCITEDVTVTDRSDAFARLGLTGGGAKAIAVGLGAPHAAAMPWFATAELTIAGATIEAVRHDFCGRFGLELFVPVERVADVWHYLVDASRSHPAMPAGNDAVDLHRIEAGIPWPGREITDEYLPAETGQLARAVAFGKGCYLGQEVVERMRSRGVVARQLVGLRFEGETSPPAGSELCDSQGKAVGVVTSVCFSRASGGPIGLGYVKTAAANAGTPLLTSTDGGTEIRATVARLPFDDVARH